MTSLPTYEFTDADLLAAMHALGFTSTAIHEALFALGIRGSKGCAEACPLAEYVLLVVRDAAYVHVYLDDDDDVYVVARDRDEGRQIEAAGLKACGEFVRDFDRHRYPDLITEANRAA